MKIAVPLISLFLGCVVSLVYAEDYWQNQVRYSINVTLDDFSHQIHGRETIFFKNNSPDRLDYLVLLLYPNAYKDETTAFARQLKCYHQRDFHFSTEQQRGWIQIDSLRINQEMAQYSYFEKDIDLAKIPLSSLLNPGDSLELELQFRVKFPASFSRMMHEGNHYEATQWYPKLAVYDRRGWAAYPYLHMGEFYGEFAEYQVFITVPKNYVVAATGVLQTESERAWLDSLAQVGNGLFALDRKPQKKEIKRLLKRDYYSSLELKTVCFWQNNVHDFAWFADKRFLVQKGKYTFPDSTTSVDLWTYCLPQNYRAWRHSLEYLHDAVKYYSEWYGNYPYIAISAVDGDISAGGGMEYPMITVIKSVSLPDIMELTIMHEAGHNWFYGILGTDERRFAWMDEGINFFSENRYFEQKYGKNRVLLLPKSWRWLMPHLTHYNLELMANNSMTRTGQNLPADLPSGEYPSEYTYGIATYFKTAVALKYLQSYLGEAQFDTLMRTYYDRWKFKHPMPDDFQRLAEEISGQNLDWFFKDYLGSDKNVDYQLRQVSVKDSTSSYNLKFQVRNKADNALPYQVEIYHQNQVIDSFWHAPKASIEHYSLTFKEKPDRVIIDPQVASLDLNSLSNVWPLGWQLHPLFDLEAPHERQFHYILLPGYNYKDGLILSGKIYTYQAPSHIYSVSAGYGFESQKPIWTINLNQTHYARLGSPKFSYGLMATDNNYGRLQVEAKAQLKSFPRFHEYRSYQAISLETNYLDLFEPAFYDPLMWTIGKSFDGKMSYRRVHKWFLDEISAALAVKQGIKLQDTESNYTKVDLSAAFKHLFSKRGSFTLSGFGGWIANNNQLPLQEHYWSCGDLDPAFNNSLVIDRSGSSVFSASQHFVSYGGPLLRGYPNWSGNQSALTLTAEIAYSVLGLFGDAGTVANEGEEVRFKSSLGLFLKFDQIGIHVPIYLTDPGPNEEHFIGQKNYKDRYYISLEATDVLTELFQNLNI